MASVSTSSKNIDMVKRHINDMKLASFKQRFNNDYTNTVNVKTSALYDLILWQDKEIIEWRDQHVEIFINRKEFQLSVDGTAAGRISLCIETNTCVFVRPPEKESRYISTTYADLVAWADAGIEGAKDVLTWVDEQAARTIHNKEWEERRTQVIHFFNQYTTFNQALKAAPSMGIYLPQWMHDKMAEKVTRAKAEIAKPTVDVGALTAAAVAVKLGGG